MTASTPQSVQQNTKGSRVGVVEKDKLPKSRRVAVKFAAPHPKYGKYVEKRTILQVHDEHNESRVGDRVEIVPCRPMSKTKRWKLIRVVEKAPEV